ncbi:hypothetical protein K490DRAFT_5171, partial [Saccharata proteae CBS 121410]
MLTVNYQSRRMTKSRCLTFGDVIVASVLQDVKIPSECMVNGGEFYRQKNVHQCHKHCKHISKSSTTGDELGHCQKCKQFNSMNNMPGLPWYQVATKRKKSLITNFGQMALTQVTTLSLLSVVLIGTSIFLGILSVSIFPHYSDPNSYTRHPACVDRALASPIIIGQVDGQNILNEIGIYAISNTAQLAYSVLYLLLLYNVTLVSMEHDWGQFEKTRQRLRCTIVKGPAFKQSYLLQLPKWVLCPIMLYSIVMHWLLSISIYAEESVIADSHSQYTLYYVATVPDGMIGSSAMLLFMTITCWWTYTYRREGFIPQMFGSMRTLCSATSELDGFSPEGIQWGD